MRFSSGVQPNACAGGGRRGSIPQERAFFTMTMDAVIFGGLVSTSWSGAAARSVRRRHQGKKEEEGKRTNLFSVLREEYASQTSG